MKKSLCGFLLVASQLPFSAAAQNNTYNANVMTSIKEVVTYTDDTTLLFTVPTQPAVPNCNASYFIVPVSVSTESRQMILSRLLSARATGEKIYIGYDGQVCGPGGYIRVFRVG